MAKLKDLDKYVNYEFSSGCYTGDDYKSFQTKYINYLKSVCKNNHWRLVNVGKIIIAFRLSSKVRKTNVFTYPYPTSDISLTNGITTYLFARLKTKRITAAVLTTIQRFPIWKALPPNF